MVSPGRLLMVTAGVFKKMKEQLPKSTIIEVVMRKNMTIADYEMMKDQAVKKGWHIQTYQQNFTK